MSDCLLVSSKQANTVPKPNVILMLKTAFGVNLKGNAKDKSWITGMWYWWRRKGRQSSFVTFPCTRRAWKTRRGGLKVRDKSEIALLTAELSQNQGVSF